MTGLLDITPGIKIPWEAGSLGPHRLLPSQLNAARRRGLQPFYYRSSRSI